MLKSAPYFIMHSYLSNTFWATVCKTVRPMPSDHCLSCLSVLSVTLVYCGQMVGWIKIPLGREVGLGPGNIVLDGDPPPPKRGPSSHPPTFRPMSIVANRWMDQDAKWYKGKPWSRPHCVRWRPSSPKRRAAPQFSARLLWPNGRPSQLLLTTCQIWKYYIYSIK